MNENIVKSGQNSFGERVFLLNGINVNPYISDFTVFDDRVDISIPICLLDKFLSVIAEGVQNKKDADR